MLALWCVLAVAAVVAVLRGEWFRATPRIGPAWTLRGEPSIFGFAAAFLAASVGASIAVTVFAPEDPAAPLRMMAGRSVLAHAAQIAVVAFLFTVPQFRPRGAHTAVARGGVHQHPRGALESLVMALAAALMLWPVTQAIGGGVAWVQSWWGAVAPAVAHQTLEALSHSGVRDPWWWLAILGAAVLAPVAEELLYRGLLQQGLKAAGLKPRGAIAVTSILFAIVHWGVLTEGSQVGALATLVVLSVGWGMLYERTGRLWAPMIAHAAFNAANLWVALRG